MNDKITEPDMVPAGSPLEITLSSPDGDKVATLHQISKTPECDILIPVDLDIPIVFELSKEGELYGHYFGAGEHRKLPMGDY